MRFRRPLLIASLTTTSGRVRVQAVWVRTTYVLRLTGSAVALRALLIDVRSVAANARQISLRPPQPITDLAAIEPFFDTVSARWRVRRVGPFSASAPGLPADPLPSTSAAVANPATTQRPPCPAVP